jgi:hypothetical protein
VTLDELRASATLEEGDHHAWDTMAVELEVAELLYALVRQMKPQLVIEAGSGRGYSSVFLACALRDNGKGTLISYEPDDTYALEATARLCDLPARVVHGRSTGHDGSAPGFVFVDSLGDYRESDIAHWLPTGALVAIHDANGYPPETFPSTGVLLTAGRGLWIGRS